MYHEQAPSRLLDDIERRVKQLAQHCANCPQFTALYQELVRRVEQLSLLMEVSKAVAGQLDLEPLLQQIADVALHLVDAEMGGLLVLNEADRDGTIFQFFKTSGCLSEPDILPTDVSILTLPCRQRAPVRLDDLRAHPQSMECFPGHLPVSAYLSVPLMHKECVLGALFVANSPSGSTFGPSDEDLLLAFAAQAAVAVENARLYARADELARLQERQRIAQTLHDTVVQMLFTIGLEAEQCIKYPSLDGEVKQRLQTIHRLGSRSSCELRRAIFALRSIYLGEGDNLLDLLHDQVSDFQAQSGIAATLFAPSQLPGVPPPIGEAIYRIVCESLSNVQKHADALAVFVSLDCDNISVIVTIQDNGVGLTGPLPPKFDTNDLHFGVTIMRQIAEQAQGDFLIANNDDQGVMVRARFPLLEAHPS
jgi:signal transduction histidine kinase